MKRLVTLALVIAFLVGTVGMVKAAQLTISGGDFRVHGNYVTQPNFDKDFEDDKFNLYQRFRTNLNFIANENLRAVVQLQFGGDGGDAKWGGDRRDGGITAGGFRDVNFRQAYINFLIPNTEVNVRAGYQWWALPNTLGSHIFDARSPAVVVSTPINDMVGVTFGYARSHDTADRLWDTVTNDWVKTTDEWDHLVLIVPVTMDGININPFLHYAHAGKYQGAPVWNALANRYEITPTGDEKAVNTWFFGINLTMDMFDPIVIHADFNYGTQSKPASGLKGTSGWIADLAIEYKMDMFTPMVFALYESGESKSSPAADRKGKVMPSMGLGDLNFTSFGFSGSQFGGTSWYQANRFPGLGNQAAGATGKMALGLKLKDISFMDKLTHEFQLVYYQGTNKYDSDNPALTGNQFTDRDSAWEANFNTSYQIYENLAAILELGYMDVKVHKKDDRGVNRDDASFKAAAGVRYRF